MWYGHDIVFTCIYRLTELEANEPTKHYVMGCADVYSFQFQPSVNYEMLFKKNLMFTIKFDHSPTDTFSFYSFIVLAKKHKHTKYTTKENYNYEDNEDDNPIGTSSICDNTREKERETNISLHFDPFLCTGIHYIF